MKCYLKFCLSMLIMTLTLVFLSNIAFAGKWERKADMPDKRMLFNAVEVNNLIYCISGSEFAFLHTDTIVFNPKTNKWDKCQRIIEPRWQFGTAVVDDKYIYAIGGADNDGGVGFSSVEVYDINLNKWEFIKDMPVKRAMHASVALDNKIYVIGGVLINGANRTPQMDVYAYDIATKTWSRKSDIPETSSWGTACALDGKIYYLGGYNLKGFFSNKIFEYDINIDKWSEKTNMPRPRAMFSVSVLDGKIYAIGGNLNATTTLSTIDIYDPLQDKWAEKPIEMIKGLTCHSSAVVDEKIYVLGGCTQMNPFTWPPLDILDTVYEYSEDSNIGVSLNNTLSTTWGKLKSY